MLSVIKKVCAHTNRPCYVGTFEGRPAVMAIGNVQAVFAFTSTEEEARAAARSIMPHAALSALPQHTRAVERAVSEASSCEEVLGTHLKAAFGEADWRKNVKLRAVRWRRVLVNAGLVARTARPLTMEPVTVCHSGNVSGGGLLVFRTADYLALTMGLRGSDESDANAPEVADRATSSSAPPSRRRSRRAPRGDLVVGPAQPGQHFEVGDSVIETTLHPVVPREPADDLDERFGKKMAAKMRARRR